MAKKKVMKKAMPKKAMPKAAKTMKKDMAKVKKDKY